MAIDYFVADIWFDDEITADNDAAAMDAARSWLVGLIDAYDAEAAWDHLREGDAAFLTAGVTRMDSAIDEVTGEVTITVRRVGGRVVAAE
jgi:hypothetical protein